MLIGIRSYHRGHGFDRQHANTLTFPSRHLPRPQPGYIADDWAGSATAGWRYAHLDGHKLEPTMNDKEETGVATPQPLTDRRAFLAKAGSLLGACLGSYATGLPGALAAATGTRPPRSPNVVTLAQRRNTVLESLNLESFKHQLNTRFTFQTDDGVVQTVLVEAKDLLTGKPGHEVIRDCFSVLFQGPANRPMAQGTYATRHGKLGAFDLFIVPVREDGGYLYYEAVFNHLRDGVDPSRV